MSRHPSAPIVHITLALGLAAPALVSGPALAAAPEAALAAELVQVLSVEDAARTKRVKKSHRRWRWRKDPASGTVL